VAFEPGGAVLSCDIQTGVGIEDRAAAIAHESSIAHVAQTRAREQAASAAKQWHTDVYSLLDEFFDLAEKHAAPTSKIVPYMRRRKHHAYGRLSIAYNSSNQDVSGGGQYVVLVKPRRIAGSDESSEKAVMLSKVKLTIWQHYTPRPIGHIEGALAHIVAAWRV